MLGACPEICLLRSRAPAGCPRIARFPSWIGVFLTWARSRYESGRLGARRCFASGSGSKVMLLAGLLAVGFVCNALIRPVAPTEVEPADAGVAPRPLLAPVASSAAVTAMRPANLLLLAGFWLFVAIPILLRLRDPERRLPRSADARVMRGQRQPGGAGRGHDESIGRILAKGRRQAFHLRNDGGRDGDHLDRGR